MATSRSPPGSGVVTAFSLYGSGAPGATDEVDLECVGRDTSNIQSMYFVNGQRVGNGNQEKDIFPAQGGDLATSYHTYGIEYNDNYVKWYMDGNVGNALTNNNNGQFPASLGKFRLGLWDGTQTSGWAGTVNYNQGPFAASIKWLRYTPYC